MITQITIIIVTWNNEEIITDCIDSIYKFTKTNFNILVLDNRSSDNTILKIQEKNYPQCKVIRSNDNLGFAKGNNIVLTEVRSDFICYLNPDTILIEDIITPMLNYLDADLSTGIVGCKLLNEDMTLQPSTFNFDTPFNIFCEKFRVGKAFPNWIKENMFPNESLARKNKKVDWVIGAIMVMRLGDVKEINGFSEEYFMYTEDMDICMKVKKTLNMGVYFMADISLIHLGGRSEQKNNNYKKIEIILRNTIYFAEKFGGIKSRKKTILTLKFCYYSRLHLAKIMRKMKIINNESAELLIEKMRIGHEYLKSNY